MNLRFEIASHTAEHVNMVKRSEEECIRQVKSDQEVLGRMFHAGITGFAYPFGRCNSRSMAVLKKCGITYARTASFAKNFSLPDNLLELPVTSWHVRKDALKKVREFIDSESDRDQFFLMFAHGYEFDFHTKESNFEKFKRICDMVAGRDDIVSVLLGRQFGLFPITRNSIYIKR